MKPESVFLTGLLLVAGWFGVMFLTSDSGTFSGQAAEVVSEQAKRKSGGGFLSQLTSKVGSKGDLAEWTAHDLEALHRYGVVLVHFTSPG